MTVYLVPNWLQSRVKSVYPNPSLPIWVSRSILRKLRWFPTSPHHGQETSESVLGGRGLKEYLVCAIGRFRPPVSPTPVRFGLVIGAVKWKISGNASLIRFFPVGNRVSSNHSDFHNVGQISKHCLGVTSSSGRKEALLGSKGSILHVAMK